MHFRDQEHIRRQLEGPSTNDERWDLGSVGRNGEEKCAGGGMSQTQRGQGGLQDDPRVSKLGEKMDVGI